MGAGFFLFSFLSFFFFLITDSQHWAQDPLSKYQTLKLKNRESMHKKIQGINYC